MFEIPSSIYLRINTIAHLLRRRLLLKLTLLQQERRVGDLGLIQWPWRSLDGCEA